MAEGQAVESEPTWQPLRREPDSFELAVLEAIRLTLPAAFADLGTGPRRFDGCRTRLPDGTEIVVEFAAHAVEAPPFRGRRTLGVALAGHAARPGRAWRFDGRAVVDVRSRAFLRLEIALGQTDAIRRPGR